MKRLERTAWGVGAALLLVGLVGVVGAAGVGCGRSPTTPKPSDASSRVAPQRDGSAPRSAPVLLRLPSRWPASDALLWTSARFEEVGVVGDVAYARNGCQIARIDLETGAQQTPRRVPADETGNCDIAFMGEALVSRQIDHSVFDADTFALRWSAPASRESRASILGAARGRAIVSDRLILPTGEDAPRLRALSLTDGSTLWSRGLSDVVEASPNASVVGEDMVLVMTADALRAFDMDAGGLVWERKDLGRVTIHAWSELGALVSSRDGLSLLAARTGVEKWHLAVSPTHGSSAVRQATLASDGRAFLVTDADNGVSADLSALAATDGHELWRTRIPASAITSGSLDVVLVATPARVFYAPSDVLFAVDGRTGGALWTFGSRDTSLSMQLVNRGGAILLVTTLRDGSLGFDPDRTPAQKEVAVSGVIAHAARSQTAGKVSLAGIPLRAHGSTVETDPTGRFTLRIRGRGWARVTIDKEAWLAKNPTFRAPHGYFDCGEMWSESVDLESVATSQVSPQLDVRFCGIR